jgi:aminotransferase in exopolysaccharide biosynthesis
VSAIRAAIGDESAQLHEPSFEGNEWLYVKDCLNSTFVSSVGGYVDSFERDLAAYTGSKYAISVVNGTSALHIALKLSGVVANDEVIIPALTFVATANAVTYCGATPHFVDSETRTLGIDPSKLRRYLSDISVDVNGNCVNKSTGNVIRTMVPMHAFGHPSNMDELLAIAKDFNLVIVEDAAESLGSFYKNIHTGTLGLLGVLSFNGNKTITTGGGGAILTNDATLARRAKHLTTTAKLPHKWDFRHDEIGYNYRMPNINAALGCAQLEQLEAKVTAKRELYRKYEKAFANLEGVSLVTEPPNSRSNYWLNTILLSKANESMRDEILKVVNNSGYMSRPAWILLNELEQFKDCPSMALDNSHTLACRIINIPSSASLAGRAK